MKLSDRDSFAMPGCMRVTYLFFEDVVDFLKMDHRVASVSQSVVVVSPFRPSVKGPAFVTRGRLIGSHSIGTCYRGESRVATEDSDAAYAAAAEATRPPSTPCDHHGHRPPPLWPPQAANQQHVWRQDARKSREGGRGRRRPRRRARWICTARSRTDARKAPSGGRKFLIK